ncbi:MULTISPECIES: TetR family transcriptional regulator [Psychrobacter]|jgi:AcrR family transcriptional regulator|uniref:TetR family transcriptional regulator n=1 Tax=Psychrobacter immobilis TaxID=498 RepID=A0A2V1ZWE4_PSYIM|nr:MULTISPECIES: TetR family transcriptional regulator [Psychrobacter]MBE8608511.1 TetR family transcriptional regulator [Pseudomonas lundensis]KRG34306.1 TetR family transcriptional regulator [Psychrobacter sp. P11F6]MCG3808585.1 TetR family transcriptional regulator [Psychrobacter sp. Ps4]MCG3873043.1 TetR family transcriptional regulator [Psychrobacter sp. Ps7]MDN5560016.1 TetR family transcriptional regulator [Psychrobacter sp.]
MSSREQKKLQTRHAFFNAVLDLCMTGQSFSSISLRQVTREVGVVPTAFYRHFDDMESLGRALVVEELGGTLAILSDSLQIGRKRSFDRQIAKSIQLFLYMVSDQPYYWQFLVSERYGGSEAVRKAINELVKKHAQSLADDLALQPAFTHINAYDRRLLAEAGVNMFFSWIIDWLELTYTEDHDDEIDLNEIEENKQLMLHNCTRQAQMLFYGAYNWKSTEETHLGD